MRILPALILTSIVGIALPAAAQPGGPAVSVSVGAKLAERTPDLGRSDISDLQRWLQQDVEKAVAGAGAVARVDLVIEDATPNRPTSAQLSRNAQLSAQSIGAGGARISGVVTEANGAQRPVRYQYYSGDLRDVEGGTPWFDAERAFTTLSYRIARGDVPNAYTGPGPITGEGSFGRFP